MTSKIFFFVALLLFVSWIVLCLLFSSTGTVHIIAVGGIVFLIMSYASKNDDN